MLPCLRVNQSAAISARYQAISRPAAPTLCLSKRHKTQPNKGLQRQELQLWRGFFSTFVRPPTFALSHDKRRTVLQGKERLVVTQTTGMYSSFHAGSARFETGLARA